MTTWTSTDGAAFTVTDSGTAVAAERTVDENGEPIWTSPGVTVHQRILAVMAAVKGLTPEGKISYGGSGYKYISEKQLTSAVREQMIRFGLTALPVAIEETIHEKPTGGYITRQKAIYRITNAYNRDDFVDVVSTGQGADTNDKGSGKASTNAFKYMLFRVFEIPQSDDPDDVSSDAVANRARPATSTVSHTPESVLRRRAEQQKPAGGVQR